MQDVLAIYFSLSFSFFFILSHSFSFFLTLIHILFHSHSHSFSLILILSHSHSHSFSFSFFLSHFQSFSISLSLYLILILILSLFFSLTTCLHSGFSSTTANAAQCPDRSPSKSNTGFRGIFLRRRGTLAQEIYKVNLDLKSEVCEKCSQM